MRFSYRNRIAGAHSVFAGLNPPPFQDALTERRRMAEDRALAEGVSYAVALQRDTRELIQGQALLTLGVLGVILVTLWLASTEAPEWSVFSVALIPAVLWLWIHYEHRRLK